MKVVLFAAGGDIPMRALEALHTRAEVVGLVRPGPAPGIRSAIGTAIRAMRGPRGDTLSARAREFGIPERRARGPRDASLDAWIRGRGADLVCVATFPWRLREDLIAAAPRGAINVHASLLPRHRGPNPWFWIYHADDRQAGVTVHVCGPRIDEGDIVAQSSWPLARGYPVADLHRDVAERGGALLADVVGAGDARDFARQSQDESSATRAPRLAPGAPMVDFRWPVERVWHLLAGTAGQYREPLRCDDEPVPYDRVAGFSEAAPARTPGSVEQLEPGRAWRLWCIDGSVDLERAGS